MLAMVAAADSAKVQKKKYSVFIYSKAEPHAMYAIYKLYINRRLHCVFYNRSMVTMYVRIDYNSVP